MPANASWRRTCKYLVEQLLVTERRLPGWRGRSLQLVLGLNCSVAVQDGSIRVNIWWRRLIRTPVAKDYFTLMQPTPGWVACT